MKKMYFTYPSNDSLTEIHGICWVPEGEVKAVLQIAHGMVEFIDRYDEFARFLAEKGILVAGNDHLGHGASVRSEEYWGYFAKKDGNTVLLKDMNRLRKIVQKRYPHVPYFMLGHSMGSFLMRQYICVYGEGLAGTIIMGTGYQPAAMTAMGMQVCKVLAAVKGWHHRSALVDGMAFGSYNKKFGKPTGKEWLSRNPENVQKYVKEKRCNFRFTLNGYYNLFYSIHALSNPEYLEGMPKELPVFFVAGEEDPVGQFGKGVEMVFEQFIDLGMEDVECKLYAEDRHEILNELDREDVYQDIYEWISRVLAEEC